MQGTGPDLGRGVRVGREGALEPRRTLVGPAAQVPGSTQSVGDAQPEVVCSIRPDRPFERDPEVIARSFQCCERGQFIGPVEPRRLTICQSQPVPRVPGSGRVGVPGRRQAFCREFPDRPKEPIAVGVGVHSLDETPVNEPAQDLETVAGGRVGPPPSPRRKRHRGRSRPRRRIGARASPGPTCPAAEHSIRSCRASCAGAPAHRRRLLREAAGIARVGSGWPPGTGRASPRRRARPRAEGHRADERSRPPHRCSRRSDGTPR